MSHFLVVDDDTDLAESLVDLFVIQGHTAEMVSCGEHALSKLASNTYDLVLLDWQLPDMTGIEVCNKHRTAGGASRILMLSGMRDAASRDAGFKAGITDFLVKPFSVDELIKRLDSILK